MKLIYLTSQKYPSNKVDPFYWKVMAEAFCDILKKDFVFIIRGEIPRDLKHINVKSLNFPYHARSLFYFISMPVLVFLNKWNNTEIIFFSADPYLLSILIFWRKVFWFKYKICSDWHQLFNDWRDSYVSVNSDYLICTSNKLKSLIISKHKINLNKVRVVYGGVDQKIFIEKSKIDPKKLRENLSLPPNEFLVGYVGGFRSVGMEKGIDTMIESLAFLDQSIKMVFVGGSKKHIEEYMELARKKQVEERCIFVEKQSFDKVVEFEIALDVLVIPYPNKAHFRDYGFPLKIWEYMASGRPIVYSNLEIIKEVLDKRAVSFEPSNEKSLADSINKIYNNQEFVTNSLLNRKEVELYTWQAKASNIINFIQE